MEKTILALSPEAHKKEDFYFFTNVFVLGAQGCVEIEVVFLQHIKKKPPQQRRVHS